jgi:NAD(P)-dependent dehydrogenase (short-subunit alcohol dehydrogenase family)
MTARQSSSMFDLDGRVAVVTGAGQSVGRGIAEALAAAGAVVAVNDLRADRAELVAAQITESGGSAVPAPFDVTNLEEVRAAVSGVERQLGRVDAVVNNAGRVDDGKTRLGRFRDSDPARWHLWLDLNIYGSLYLIHSVLPGMIERGFGRIIQISSGAGSRGIPSGVALYGAGKAGIEGALRHIAIEEAQSGVTFNAIALGLMANTAHRSDHNSPTSSAPGTLAAVPMGRLGEPQEIGACAVWLASDLAGFVTGQVIHLNGGTVQGR